jgi:hypothetical protein
VRLEVDPARADELNTVTTNCRTSNNILNCGMAVLASEDAAVEPPLSNLPRNHKTSWTSNRSFYRLRQTMKRSQTNVRGRHEYDETDGKGIWATIGPDADLQTPKKQTKHLRINQGSATKNHRTTTSVLTLDPVDFLLSLEKKNKKTHTYNTASCIPLQSNNSPSLLKIHTIEKNKWRDQRSYEDSLKPITRAHEDDKGYEKTALGLYATLPKKDHGPEFE